jgi:hypothetical protein
MTEEHSSSVDYAYPRYFPVSIPKLIIMSVCTFGIYELYWFYKQWQFEMKRTPQKLSPFWRAIFAIIFCYPLFQRIREKSLKHEIHMWFSPVSMALIYISLAITFSFTAFGIQVIWEHPFYITLLSVLPLAAVQSEVAKLNKKIAPAAERNARFSGLNILAILIGGSVLLFTLIFSGTVYRSFLEAIPTEGRLQVGDEEGGWLSESSSWLGDENSQHYTLAWELEGSRGETVTVDLLSSEFNPYLLITGPGLDSVLEDDDGGEGWNAQLSFIFPDEGICKVIVSSAEPWKQGGYTLRITQ